MVISNNFRFSNLKLWNITEDGEMFIVIIKEELKLMTLKFGDKIRKNVFSQRDMLLQMVNSFYTTD